MKYRRLKTLDSTGVPILRYYKLADTVAYANCFYGIANDQASKIEGAASGKALIGFSHGGNNLGKGLIFLDINETSLYMGILEEGDTKPAIGDLVNGYQRVVDTHYETESAEGKNDDGFGIEYLDVPYYIFRIEQPAASATKTITDENAGEISGVNPYETTTEGESSEGGESGDGEETTP